MWEVIAYISSGFSLAAFVTAVAAWILKAKSEEKAHLISTADNDVKAELVQDAMEFFHIDTQNLTPEQQFILAIEQIRNRANRFRTIALLIGFLSILATSLSAYAISKKEISTKEISTKANIFVREAVKTKAKDPCDLPFDQRPIDCILKEK